jgi:hypothetical protein
MRSGTRPRSCRGTPPPARRRAFLCAIVGLRRRRRRPRRAPTPRGRAARVVQPVDGREASGRSTVPAIAAARIAGCRRIHGAPQPAALWTEPRAGVRLAERAVGAAAIVLVRFPRMATPASIADGAHGWPPGGRITERAHGCRRTSPATVPVLEHSFLISDACCVRTVATLINRNCITAHWTIVPLVIHKALLLWVIFLYYGMQAPCRGQAMIHLEHVVAE